MFQRENEPKKTNQNQNLKMESSAPWVGGPIRDKSCICTYSYGIVGGRETLFRVCEIEAFPSRAIKLPVRLPSSPITGRIG